MAVGTYAQIATNVKDFLVGQITPLDATTASVGDIDAVVDALYEDNTKTVGLLVDFLYSVPHAGDSGRRTNDLWDTFVGGLLILQYTGRDGTETSKETLLNLLWRAFDSGSAKVINKTDRVSIVRIDAPEKTALGEHPFYFVPFTVMVNHGGKA